MIKGILLVLIMFAAACGSEDDADNIENSSLIGKSDGADANLEADDFRYVASFACGSGESFCVVEISKAAYECPFAGSDVDCKWNKEVDLYNDYITHYKKGDYSLCEVCEPHADLEAAALDAANTASRDILYQTGWFCSSPFDEPEDCTELDTLIANRLFNTVDEVDEKAYAQGHIFGNPWHGLVVAANLMKYPYPF